MRHNVPRLSNVVLEQILTQSRHAYRHCDATVQADRADQGSCIYPWRAETGSLDIDLLRSAVVGSEARLPEEDPGIAIITDGTIVRDGIDFHLDNVTFIIVVYNNGGFIRIRHVHVWQNANTELLQEQFEACLQLIHDQEECRL